MCDNVTLQADSSGNTFDLRPGLPGFNQSWDTEQPTLSRGLPQFIRTKSLESALNYASTASMNTIFNFVSVTDSIVTYSTNKIVAVSLHNVCSRNSFKDVCRLCVHRKEWKGKVNEWSRNICVRHISRLYSNEAAYSTRIFNTLVEKRRKNLICNKLMEMKSQNFGPCVYSLKQ